MVVAELAIGAVGEFLNSGLKRAVSAPFQKIARLEKVDHAARLRASADPIVKQAIDDYVRVLGSYQGKYTTIADAFLKELEASGIIELMVENALIDRASEPVKNAFLSLHSHIFGTDEDGVALYDSMMAAFTASMRASANDPVMFSLARSMQNEIRERLDSVDHCLKGIELSKNKESQLSEKQLGDLLQRIAKGLQQSYKNIRIETNRGPKNVEINRIYVPAKLSFRESKANEKRISDLARTARRASPSVLRDRNLTYTDYLSEMKTTTYSEFADMFRRAVVLGDPGGGKSTLCQKFCYETAKGLSLSLSFGEKSGVTANQRRLPIRVILRKFEQARDKDPQLDLLTYIVRDTINICGGTAAETEEALKHYLQMGKVVIAFDGLDEILDTSMRQDYCDLVTAFCNQFPLCSALVTSRFVGYDDARLTDDFEEMVLEKFDESEITSYVNKFMTVVGGQTKAKSTESSVRFAEQTKNAGADLRRNPLMLGLMGWLFLNNDDIPSNRPEIYKECATLMFERWDQRRGIIADDMSEFDRSQLFIHLASQMYGEPSLAGGVSKEWLSSSLKAAFFQLYENNARAFQASTAFVKFITGRAWIMSEIGEGVYAFTHQTFLEYFFARHLEDRFDSVSSLLRALKPRIFKSEWDEVNHLALQIKTNGSLRKQEEALTILSSFLGTVRGARQKQALLTFCSRSLEYLSPPEGKVGAFLNGLYPHIFNRASEGHGELLSMFGVLSNASPERRNYVRAKVLDALSNRLLQNDGGKEFKVLVNYLSNHAASIDQPNGSAHNRHLTVQMHHDILRRLNPEVIKRSYFSTDYQILAWQWYGHYDETAPIADVFCMIYNNPVMGSIGGVDGVTSLAINVSHLKYGVNHRTAITKEASKDLLKLLAERVTEILPINRSKLSKDHYIGLIPVAFWKQVFAANDQFGVRLGVVLAAVVHSNSYFRRRGDAFESNRSKMYDWALKWLRRPENCNRTAARELISLIEENRIVSDEATAVTIDE